MSIKKALLWIVLLDFAAFSGWVMWEIGYLGIWQAGMSSPGAIQILIDLVILGGLFCTWMIKDARKRQVNPWPWVVSTFALGSLVPLTYLLVREYKNGDQQALQTLDPVINHR